MVSRFLSGSIFIVPLLVSCIAHTNRTSLEINNPIGMESVNKIIKGGTTKSQIVDMFGLPHAIAKKGKAVLFKPGSRMPSDGMDSHVFFEIFNNNKITDKHIVYFYFKSIHEVTTDSVMLFPMPFSQTTDRRVSDKVSRLWVLINNEVGIVEDYVFEGVVANNDER